MAADLAPEDSLRLNVLVMAQPVQAVRIDEGELMLRALTEGGEASIQLHPNCRVPQYLARVREFLAGHALGSPGGYPVYLQRWTRMGQTSDRNLAALLMLGEPEAVVAVAHAPGLTDELARRVWWCQPSMEIARWMLERESVVNGRMGKVLADFLVEHLPFEQNPDARMHTARLVLHGRLTDAQTTAKLWRMAKGVPCYYIGFLDFRPEALPQDEPSRSDHAAASELLAPLAAGGNAYAERMLALLAANGQTFLKAAATVLARPSTPVVVNALLDAVGRFLAPTGPAIAGDDLDQLFAQARATVRGDREAPPALRALLDTAPGHRSDIEAMLALSGLSSRTAEPWLLRNLAVGAQMRRKIEPLVAPIDSAIQVLRTPIGSR